MTDFASLTISVDATQAKTAANELDKLADSGQRLESDIKRTTSNTTASFNNLSGGIESAASNIKASLLGAAAGFASVQTAVKSFSAFVDFERSVSSLSTVILGSSEVTAQLRDESIRLGEQYGKMPTEQAKAFYQIISSGVTDATKATELLDEANKLSVGGMADLFQTADALTSILAAYGDKVKSVSDVSDILFTGTLAGKTTIDELANSIGRVSPLAENAGVSFDELVASVSALTLSGISTQESITGVRAILASIIKPSKESADLAKDLGIQFNAAGLQAKGFGGFMEEVVRKTGGSSEAISLLFGGIEAIVPALAFAGNAGKQFADIMGQMETRAGSTQTAFEKMAASPGFKIDQLMAQINSMAIRLGDTLAGFLIPAVEGASKALNGLFGSNKLSAIDQQKQAIAGLKSELQSLNDRKNIPLVGELLFDKKQADELKSRIDHAEADLVKLSEAAKNVQSVIPKAEVKTNNAFVMPEKKSSGSRSKEISESERFLKALQQEAEQAGKTEIEILQLKAAKLGLSDASAPLIAQIEKSSAAMKAQRDQAGELVRDLQEVESVTQSVKTAEEKLADETARLNRLLNLPNNAGISIETYGRAIKKAQDEFVKLSTQSKKSFDEVSQFAIQAERNIQTSFGDALRQGFEGNLSGMVSSFKSALAQMVAQAISADVLGSIFGRSQGFSQTSILLDQFKAVLSGGKGASGTDTTSSLLNGITGLGNTFKDGFSGLSKTFTSGFSSFRNLIPSFGRNVALGTGVGGLGGAGSALANGVGTGTAATGGLAGGLGTAAGAAAIAFISTQVFRGLAGDKRLGGGFGKAVNAIGDLPIIGDLFPIAPALNFLFGRGPLKQKETNLIGTASESGFSGITSTKFKAEGGLLVGDKVIRIQADTDTGKLLQEFNGKLKDTAQAASDAARIIDQFIDEGITALSDSIKKSADVLGIGTDVLNGFSQSINIASEKGKALSEEQLAKVITDFGDAMAKQLIPNIDQMSKRGESASDTFLRLGNEFQVLTNTLEVLGKSTAQANQFLKDVSFEARESFLKIVGGADKLNNELEFFSQNFLTVEERLKPVAELVNKTFKELNVSGITTNEQFASLVKSQDLTTESGQKMFSSLLEIQDEFLQLTSTFGQFGGTVAETTEIIKKANEEQERAASRRAEIAQRDKARLKQEEETKKLEEARLKEKEEAISLRDELLRSGDAIAIMRNELKATNFEINKDADPAAEFAKLQAKLSVDLIQAASSAAIEIRDVKSLLNTLYRNIVSSQVVEPIYRGIKDSILSGIDEFGKVVSNIAEKDRRANSTSINSISKAVDGFAKVMATQRAARDANSGGQGIASVLAARRNLNLASQTESVAGKLQFGGDVIAYAKAINQLNKDFANGIISANQHKQAIAGLNKISSDSAKLLNNTALQMERIEKASLNLGKSGLDSIGFYFNSISKSVRELDKQADQLGEPLGKVAQAVGKMKSIAFVFRESAEAVRDGFKDFAPTILRGLEGAGKALSKSDIVGKAAQLAAGVLNTQSGKEKEQVIKSDPLFKNKDSNGLSKLIEGVVAFDPESFERSFLRISDALNKNKINEAQFAKLFNIALDSFEGLSNGAGRAAGGLNEIGRAAKSAADNIRLDRKLTILNPQQQLQVAQTQFIDIINRAKGGDKEAASQMEGAARTLLETGQISLSNQTDLFTFVQAKLREVEGSGKLQSLEVDANILKQLEAMNKRMEDQQKVNLSVSAQIASIQTKTADTLERWEKIGMPATRT